jgi:hypothetical protein
MQFVGPLFCNVQKLATTHSEIVMHYFALRHPAKIPMSAGYIQQKFEQLQSLNCWNKRMEAACFPPAQKDSTRIATDGNNHL